jgi:spore coat protein U-like protein
LFWKDGSMFNMTKIALAGGFALALGSAADAATTSGNLSVSANIAASCAVSTNPVAFGSVNPLSGSATDASGAISVTCTSGTAWSAAAGSGAGTGATIASRAMTSGSNLLNYSLYTDSGHSTLWGDGTLSTAAITGTGNGSAQSSTIYGRVPSGQSSAPTGSYSDTVAITVTY